MILVLLMFLVFLVLPPWLLACADVSILVLFVLLPGCGGHDIGVIEHISDRVVVMYLGRIVETAPIEIFVEKPNHPYTKALLDGVPRLEIGKRNYEPVSGEIPSPLEPPSGCHFHPRCSYASEICKKEEPNMQEIEPMHFVSCHHFKDIQLKGIE